MLRDLGVSYREMEDRGYILPVAEAHCKYKNPAKYDDLLTFRSWVSELRGVQLTVTTEVWREDTLLVVGEVKLACVNAEHKLSGRRVNLCQCRTQIDPSAGLFCGGLQIRHD